MKVTQKFWSFRANLIVMVGQSGQCEVLAGQSVLAERHIWSFGAAHHFFMCVRRLRPRTASAWGREMRHGATSGVIAGTAYQYSRRISSGFVDTPHRLSTLCPRCKVREEDATQKVTGDYVHMSCTLAVCRSGAIFA